MLSVSGRIAYGLSDTLEIEAEAQNRSRSGGIFDGLVQAFHDLTGVSQNGRDEVPKGRFLFELDPRGGKPIVLDSGDRGTFSRSVGLTLQHNVTCGTQKLPAISYAVTARTETADTGDVGSGSNLDIGVSVALARRFRRFYLYGTLGHTWFGQNDSRGLELDSTQFSGLLAVEWRFRSRMSLIPQYLYSEGVLDSFNEFSDASNEITGGWKWEVVENQILEAGLIENIISFDNSSDFGIHVGYSRRF